jgi:hypothetical protein
MICLLIGLGNDRFGNGTIGHLSFPPWLGGLRRDSCFLLGDSFTSQDFTYQNRSSELFSPFGSRRILEGHGHAGVASLPVPPVALTLHR